MISSLLIFFRDIFSEILLADKMSDRSRSSSKFGIYDNHTPHDER